MKSKTVGPKALVTKYEDEIQKRLLGLSSLIDKSVKDFFEEYIEIVKKTKRPRTAKIVYYALKPFILEYSKVNLNKITPQDLERFKNKLLSSGKKTNGINIVIRNLKTFFNHAMNLGYVEKSPTKGLKQFEAKEVARFLTRDELARLYLGGSKRFRQVVAILVYTGMRLGEFIHLKPQDIKGGNIYLKQTKTGKARVIPIPKKVHGFLLNQVGNWYLDYFEKAFRVATQKARLGKVRTHDLRHTFASSYLQSGGTLADLKEITGHKSITSLEIYTHFQKTYLAERINQVRI